MPADATSHSMESPFRSHLGTNYVPSDPEIEEIAAHLAPHAAELARLDALLLELTTQRDRVKDYIDSHKALTSYPRRLPHDLIQEIFLRCLPTRHNAVMSPTEPPLLLGRICSAWRSIAFALPQLWASLHVPLDFTAATEDRKSAAVGWLERSVPLPIRLSIVASRLLGNNLSINEWLLPFSTRWGIVHTLDPHDAGLMDLLEDVNAPRLEEVQVVLADDHLEAEDGEPLLSSPIFRGMGCCRATIVAPTLGAFIPASPFRWDHLARLTLKCSGEESTRTGGLSRDAAYAVLYGCGCLRSIQFQLSSNHPTEWARTSWDKERLSLPLLESMTIVESHWAGAHEDLVSLVENLEMPKLVKFHLPATSMSSSKETFLKYLGTHSPNLSDLRIGFDYAPPTSIVETFQLFPLLTNLWLVYTASPENIWTNSIPSAEELLSTLTSDSPEPNPWPALTELIIEPVLSCEERVWMDFLRGQLKRKTNLRRFELILSEDPPTTLPDIQTFLGDGLDVLIRYIPFFKEEHTAWEGINGDQVE